MVDLVKNIDRGRYDISVCGIRGGPLKKEIEALGISVHVVGKRTWWELPWIAFQLYKQRQKASGADLAQLKPPHINPADTTIDFLVNAADEVRARAGQEVRV